MDVMERVPHCHGTAAAAAAAAAAGTGEGGRTRNNYNDKNNKKKKNKNKKKKKRKDNKTTTCTNNNGHHKNNSNSNSNSISNKKRKKKKKKSPALAVSSNWKALLAATAGGAQPSGQEGGKSKSRKRKRDEQGGKTTDGSPFAFSTSGSRNKLVDKKPLPYSKYSGPGRWITPAMDCYQSVVERSYRGFVQEPARTVPQSFHDHALQSFQRLRSLGLFQYDVVQAGGKRLSRTFVRRTLIGDPGITYKYLGLRIFAHDWSSTCPVPSSRSHSQSQRLQPDLTRYKKSMAAVRDMNEQLKRRSEKILDRYKEKGWGGGYGSKSHAAYNLTLINLMEPDDTDNSKKSQQHSKGPALKDESLFGMGKCSVSWHADSSLQDFSTIAVYHVTGVDAESTCVSRKPGSAEWRIGLRVTNDKVTPPLLIPLPSQDIYYMCGNFNHHHEHAVMAGSNDKGLRYSSTHRVAVTEKDTWGYVKKKIGRCKVQMDARSDGKSIQVNSTTVHVNPKSMRLEQELLSECESEWLMQYWCQGEGHDQTHLAWQLIMRNIERAWKQLESRTALQVHQLLRIARSIGRESASASVVGSSERGRRVVKSIDVMVQGLEQRVASRKAWDRRLSDRVYKQLPPMYRPVKDRLSYEIPIEMVGQAQQGRKEKKNITTLPKYCEDMIEQLRSARSNVAQVLGLTKSKKQR